MTTESTPAKVRLSDQLGPAVPQEVMTYLHAYGDSRADDDGLSGLRIGEAVLALRRWAADVQSAERERCRRIVQLNQFRNGHHTHEGTTMGHYEIRMFDEIDSGLPPKA